MKLKQALSQPVGQQAAQRTPARLQARVARWTRQGHTLSQPAVGCSRCAASTQQQALPHVMVGRSLGDCFVRDGQPLAVIQAASSVLRAVNVLRVDVAAVQFVGIGIVVGVKQLAFFNIEHAAAKVGLGDSFEAQAVDNVHGFNLAVVEIAISALTLRAGVILFGGEQFGSNRVVSANFLAESAVQPQRAATVEFFLNHFSAVAGLVSGLLHKCLDVGSLNSLVNHANRAVANRHLNLVSHFVSPVVRYGVQRMKRIIEQDAPLHQNYFHRTNPMKQAIA